MYSISKITYTATINMYNNYKIHKVSKIFFRTFGE